VTLPTKLRTLRARAGLTLIDAAKRAGIGRDTLSDIERGRRHPRMPTLRALADAYGVDVSELVEEGPSEGLSAQEWARRQGARLHGMTAEEWDDYVRAHDTVEGVTETWKEIYNESRMLHAAISAHKWQRPQDRGRRQSLGRGLRDLRMHRYGNLQTTAMMLHARDLVDEIFAEMKREAAEA
jgi:transcriptional regulator with XRE-family HTH domain